MRASTLTALHWLVLAIMLGAPALVVPAIPIDTPTAWPTLIAPLVLHPEQGLAQTPLSWWAAAWLHGSPAHKTNNLLALGLLIALALQQRTPISAAWAWFFAWPLTHLGMIFRPELSTYIGLSGVLHAGATILALSQISDSPHRSIQALGWILFAGLLWKVLIMENPWSVILIPSHSSDINVAPWAHLSGIVAGSVCGATARLMPSPQVERHKPTQREL